MSGKLSSPKSHVLHRNRVRTPPPPPPPPLVYAPHSMESLRQMTNLSLYNGGVSDNHMARIPPDCRDRSWPNPVVRCPVCCVCRRLDGAARRGATTLRCCLERRGLELGRGLVYVITKHSIDSRNYLGIEMMTNLPAFLGSHLIEYRQGA